MLRKHKINQLFDKLKGLYNKPGACASSTNNSKNVRLLFFKLAAITVKFSINETKQTSKPLQFNKNAFYIKN